MAHKIYRVQSKILPAYINTKIWRKINRQGLKFKREIISGVNITTLIINSNIAAFFQCPNYLEIFKAIIN